MNITYVEHPTFDFDILVDIYSNRQLVLPMTITNVDRYANGHERMAKVTGYVEVDVPIDVCSARLVDKDEHLAEVAREAHKRNITSVKTRCVFSVMLDGRAYKAVKSYDQINMSRYFDVEMVGYMMNDEFIDNQQLVLENELHSYATYYITCFMNKSFSNRANLMIARKGLRR